ncbi:MAG: hydrogen gas-evolving membrane-bound hydrogenase subunit E [Elusimicrobiota bacterium]
MRGSAWAAVLFVGGVLFYAAPHLPAVGDPHAPASEHVSPRYIEGSLEEMATPNMVTTVIADYRGFDTLGETTVIFAAGFAALLILSEGRRRKRKKRRDRRL